MTNGLTVHYAPGDSLLCGPHWSSEAFTADLRKAILGSLIFLTRKWFHRYRW